MLDDVNARERIGIRAWEQHEDLALILAGDLGVHSGRVVAKERSELAILQGEGSEHRTRLDDPLYALSAMP
jgi:hypothetical protein